MLTLALDLGLSAGYALHDGREIVSSGAWQLDRAAPSRAYLALRCHLLAALDFRLPDARRPALVAYEAVPGTAHRGGDAAHRWGGLEAILLAECETRRVRYLGVSPATWKRAAGLRSGSRAPDALRAARARWPDWTPAGRGAEDEAVARWIAVAAAGRVG